MSGTVSGLEFELGDGGLHSLDQVRQEANWKFQLRFLRWRSSTTGKTAYIQQVYRTTLQAKGDAETSNNPIMARGSGSQVSTTAGGRAFLSTGLFPMP